MFPQVLVIVSSLLARLGGYDGYTPVFGSTLDHTWLGYLTVGGWLIIIVTGKCPKSNTLFSLRAFLIYNTLSTIF